MNCKVEAYGGSALQFTEEMQAKIKEYTSLPSIAAAVADSPENWALPPMEWNTQKFNLVKIKNLKLQYSDNYYYII